MHAPPAVRVTLAPDRWWIAFSASIAALAAGNLAAWLAPTWMAVLPTALAGSLGAAWIARRRSPQGALAWDGQTWLWVVGGCEPLAGDATVAIDLDRWMLLVFASGRGARRWVALSRGAQAGAWSPLRAALSGARPAL